MFDFHFAVLQIVTEIVVRSCGKVFIIMQVTMGANSYLDRCKAAKYSKVVTEKPNTPRNNDSNILIQA